MATNSAYTTFSPQEMQTIATGYQGAGVPGAAVPAAGGMMVPDMEAMMRAKIAQQAWRQQQDDIDRARQREKEAVELAMRKAAFVRAATPVANPAGEALDQERVTAARLANMDRANQIQAAESGPAMEFHADPWYTEGGFNRYKDDPRSWNAYQRKAYLPENATQMDPRLEADAQAMRNDEEAKKAKRFSDRPGPWTGGPVDRLGKG